MSDDQVPEYVHKATAAKLEAETAALAAQARKADAEAEFFAEQARHQAEVTRMQRDLAEKSADDARVRLAGNEFHGVFYYASDVSEKSADVCVRWLDQQSRLYPGRPVEIVFTSPGGDVVAGMRLFDHITALRDSGTEVTIGCRGIAASMAGILLQAGTTRWMGRESYVLIHQISAGVSGSYGDIEDRVKWFDKLQSRILDVFAARSKKAGENGTATNPLTRREFAKRWERTDWWLDSDECLKHGVVDEIR